MEAVEIRRLKVRREFLQTAKGRAARRHLVVVQGRDRKDGQPHVGEGFTTTRKIGGAVVRNRARRRLRVASRELLPQHALPGFDYVFIARAGTATAPWDRLLDDVETALIRLHREISAK
ncbi:MAG: ribonuclease P protein component [Hyphomonadaceae bacterium TMED5]|nr:MAG: ribonuclease P protein component [Hyphomonadaceae bacterium TMED5]